MLNKLTDIGEKLAKVLGDKTNLGVQRGTTKTPLMESTMLSNFLHYEAFDQDTNIYINKKSCGFILEATPLIGASDEAASILSSIITDVLPEEVDLQFLLWGSNKVGDVLDQFEAERSGKGEIFEWLAKKRTEFLREGVNQSLIPSGNYVIRDFRLFIVVSQQGKISDAVSMKLMELRDSITSSFKSINMLSQNLGIEGFLSVMNDLINPTSNITSTKQKWNQFDSLSMQLTDPEYKTTVFPNSVQFASEQEKIEARALTVKTWPNEARFSSMIDSIGQMFNASLQFPCPFVISFSLRVLNPEKAAMKAQYKFMNIDKTAKSPLARFKPLINKEHQDWDYVRTRLAEGDKLVKAFFQVILYAPEKTAGSAERKIRDLYMANGWKLKKEVYLQFQSWLAMLPMRMSEGMYDDLVLMGRMRTLTAANAINLAPIHGEWKGSPTPSLLLPGRRGQLATWNPFDNTEGNYNIAIAAASGKGKSMFTQEYITCLVGSGAKVWVIDVGRSYEKTCKMLGGTFIEFIPEKRISLNPFTFIKDFESSLAMLKPLLAVMARPTGNTSDEETSFLEKALKAAWDEKRNDASITTVANWLKGQNNGICRNLSDLLYTYTEDGMYGRYFEGPSNIDLDSFFVVLELQELKSKKDLQKIILLVLMYQISEAMYLGSRSQIKSCVIDEAWDLLGGENDSAAKFIEVGYRTARRYKANFVTITQSINDYFKNATSRAALENSDYSIILGQKPESIDQLKSSGRFNLTPFAERLFKSLRKTDDYSECIIKDPAGMSVHRIIFDPYSRILFSSKGDEFEAVNKLVAQGNSLRDSIEIVARKFSHVRT
jgi:conjugal transfer ATP-binding protein TraC